MGISRRELLKHFALVASAARLSPMVFAAQRAFGESGADPESRFVLIRVAGAMDSTLGLHPVTTGIAGIDRKDLFLGYDPSSVLPVRDTRIALGPSAEPIMAFAEKMAILRGIYVGPNDLGHPFAIQHMTSGRTQESAPYWTAYLGRHFKSPGTYVITNAAIQTGNVGSFPTLLTSVLRSQMGGAPNQIASSLSLYRAGGLGLNRYLEFQAQTDKIKKFSEAVEDSKKTKSELADEDLIVASLYSGIGRVAQLDFDGNTGESLDTHTGHEQQHLNAQKNRWERIAAFLKQLEKYNLMEKTLVVVITEFNRTPGLNDNGGKDHNYSDNAAAIFGRGVRGGNVVGDRRLFMREDGFPYAYWAGSFLDFRSGESVKVGHGESVPDGLDLIRPADLWRTIAASLDPSLGRSDEMNSKESRIIPGLFSSI